MQHSMLMSDPTVTDSMTDSMISPTTVIQPADSGPVNRPPETATRPRYETPALAVLLIATAIAYLWDLGRNGWGNTFYAAAVQAGTKSWKAFFYGSFDSGNFITVDKPPASLWIMSLSGRIFGFNSWSMLAPEALLGVAAVALLYAAVRRVWGGPAGLLAGAALATTPAAALMFRFNNPDAALTLLLVAAAYTLTRAVEGGRMRWLMATALLIGTAFLAKELQAMLVLPGLALAYLVAAPVPIWKRIWQLLAAGAVLVVSGLWWPLLVDAIPAASRPYIGGSTKNSVIQLALGYNGLGRVTGNENGAGGPGPRLSGNLPGAAEGLGNAGQGRRAFGGGGGPGFGGSTGITRMLSDQFGGLVAWLLPVAIIGLLAGVWLTHRAPRTDARRASLVVWGGWLLVTTAVLSFSSGIIHPYYTVALAPGVAAMATMTLPALWQRRDRFPARAVLAVMTATAGVTAYVLLGRATGWLPWLRWTVLVAGLLAALGLLAVPLVTSRLGRRAGGGIAVAALLAGAAAPVAWSADTIGTTHTGSVPTAGPAQASGGNFPGGGAFRQLQAEAGAQSPNSAELPNGAQLPEGLSSQLLEELRNGQQPGGFPGGGRGGPDAGNEKVDSSLVAALRKDAGKYRWSAAASSSMSAGPLELASGTAVMSLGGFSGSDPAITLNAFKADVTAGKVHYFISEGTGGGGFGGGPGGGFGGDPSGTGQISTWVASAFTSSTVGGYTVYDLSKPKG